MAASKALVLVTGANQGIGFQIAQQLAASGKYKVLLGSRSSSKADDAIQRLLADKQYPVEEAAVSPISIDISQDNSIIAAVNLVKEEHGSLDILINNAGTTGTPGLSVRESFRAVYETNVFGVASVIDAFLPLLRASKYHDRRIVNVSSGQGRIAMALARGTPENARTYGVPQYRSSKAALNMLTALHSIELAEDGIVVVGAAPGYCRTEMNGGAGSKDAIDGARVIIRAATEGNSKELSGTLVSDEHAQFGW